jgi:hypothetical protein
MKWHFNLKKVSKNHSSSGGVRNHMLVWRYVYEIQNTSSLDVCTIPILSLIFQFDFYVILVLEFRLK